MSWYRDPNVSGTTHTRRASVSVDNQGGSPGSVDVTIVVPSAWDAFWTEINQTDARDVRVVDPNGNILSYDLNGLNIAGRLLTLRVDGYSAPSGAMFQLFIYWNNPDAVTQAATVSISAAKTGYVNPCSPPTPVFVYARERFQDARPGAKLSKGADETILCSVDFGGMLNKRRVAYAGHTNCEEISFVSVTGGGAATSSIRIMEGRYVYFSCTAGSDGTDYTISVTCTTTEGQVFVKKIWLAVRTVDEA